MEKKGAAVGQLGICGMQQWGMASSDAMAGDGTRAMRV